MSQFELEPQQCLKLLRLFHGLCDTGYFWHETLDKHHVRDMKMNQLRIDPVLYFLDVNGTLMVLSDSYVDDPLRCLYKRQAF